MDLIPDDIDGVAAVRNAPFNRPALLDAFAESGRAAWAEAEPGLRLLVPRPEYLFAMKCRAMWLGGVDANRDIEHIRHLAVEIGIRNVEEAIALVSSFYPRSVLLPKVQFGLDEIFSAMQETAPHANHAEACDGNRPT